MTGIVKHSSALTKSVAVLMLTVLIFIGGLFVTLLMEHVCEVAIDRVSAMPVITIK
ncbi:hypothetical protein [Serratia marcescens]|uniref:hypothetical protein n=1 Tax=Serratia marcescens TaxID=615 RepID=UPI001639CCE5|nr:hypothetical protein [Serratia marcescens]HEJ7121870.1 hypothetical protein [Serratia marcescens]